MSRPTSTIYHHILFFLCLLFAQSVAAQCLEGNCQQGEGSYRYPDGRRYTGAFQGGQAQGEGVLWLPNGEHYRGRFYQGQPHGQGSYYYPDGRKRSGTWRNGQIVSGLDEGVQLEQKSLRQVGCLDGDCINGQGSYLTPGGTLYVGEFRNGEIHGYGVCTYPDGSRYEGQWVNRLPHGQGHKTWPDGREFTGQWAQGQPLDGRGVYQHPNQAIHVDEAGYAIQSGCIQGDCANGTGTFAFADGSRYEGQFLGGHPHGQGTFYYPNGDRYQGGFSRGLPHGQGVRYYTDGRERRGQWEEGVYVVPRPASASVGCLSGDCKEGYGNYRYEDGNLYAGTFQAGKPQGYGTVTYQNGDRYVGGMAAGAFSGYGTFYQASGGIFQGRWLEGQYLGNTAAASNQTSLSPTNEEQSRIKTWALVIGVSSYRHMPALRFPDDDAYRLFAFLKSPQGGAVPDDRIRILIDEDATKLNITQAMQDLFLKAGPEDLILLYFSGHGLPGAFLPIDYKGGENVLTHQEIKRWLDASPAAYKLCLADACHSGGLLAARGGGPAGQILSRYYDDLARSKPGTALIMSSKADETSLESSGLRQGVFSHFLLRGLQGEADHDADGIVRIEELFNYIKHNTEAYTQRQQSPMLQGDYDRQMPISVVQGKAQ